MRIATIACGIGLVVVGGVAYVSFGRAPSRLPDSRVAMKVVPDAPRVETARLFSVSAPPREPDLIAAKLTTTHPVPPPQMTPGRWPDVPRAPQAAPGTAPKAKAAVKVEKPKTKQAAKPATPSAKPKTT